jgi:transcriptional regulator with XRE-family HTH domain
MDVHGKLQQLLDEHGWSKYQLARRCGLSDATIANIFRRNTMPSIPTLEAICHGYGITLSQFFAEGEMVELTPALKEVFDNWISLSPEQKIPAQQMLKAMNPK